MGQRLQAFIHCINPTTGIKAKLKSLQKYGGTKSELDSLQEKVKQYENAFGSKPNTVVAFHHQWLYGRSSLIGASNLIEFNINCEKDYNPFKTETDIFGDEYLSLLTNLLGLFKSKLAKSVGRYGYEHFRLLNFSEPEMRSDITLGDNNDGVFVVDCINDSYCFVNIGTGDFTIAQLPVLTPSSANEYVKLYYPTELADSKTANIPESADERTKYFIDNHRLNRLFTKSFSEYRLMTKGELKKLFPESFKVQTTTGQIEENKNTIQNK